MTTKELERVEEIKIDPATGLPELPEGCIWEIAQNSAEEDVLRVLRYGTESKIVHVRTWKTLWLVEEAVRADVTGYHVWLAEYFERLTPKNIYDDDEIPDCVKYKYAKEGQESAVYIPFTKEGIEYMARRVYRRLQACVAMDESRKADAEFRKSVYGQYPPKSL